MTITRQDLEDAAKAAGIEGVYAENGYRKTSGIRLNSYLMNCDLWNPATNPADAFDLAMRCGMNIDFELGGCWTNKGRARKDFTPDNMAECCEAIVLAAAEMWKNRK